MTECMNYELSIVSRTQKNKLQPVRMIVACFTVRCFSGITMVRGQLKVARVMLLKRLKRESFEIIVILEGIVEASGLYFIKSIFHPSRTANIATSF